jgi:hypothetical protein
MKAILLVFGLVVTTSACLGQGSVNFQNSTTTRVYLCDGTPVPAGNRFNAELMYAPDGTPSYAFDVVATRVGAPASFGGSLMIPGIFVGGGRTVQTITPPGGFGLFQVRVWETAFGRDYSSAILSGDPRQNAGKSGIIRVDTGDSTTTPPGTPVSLVAYGLTSFYLYGPPCPEPSTWVMGALAGRGVLAVPEE